MWAVRWSGLYEQRGCAASDLPGTSAPLRRVGHVGSLRVVLKSHVRLFLKKAVLVKDLVVPNLGVTQRGSVNLSV